MGEKKKECRAGIDIDSTAVKLVVLEDIIICKQYKRNIRNGDHDLRHTFATMALENGMDIKTLSAMIGHVSAETTLNIYSHITDTMQQQAAVKIDR